MSKLKIIVSGGGTGGHIFPALSIANAIREKAPDTEFLFVGAEGRMEMERVPAAGYTIVGLPVMGFPRKPGIKTIKFFVSLIKSLLKARKVMKSFDPDAVVGVGGYASGPVLRMASKNGIPTLIQEQNSYAGITNRMLSKRVDKICVAYDNMERYFPKSKIIFTGNPVRKSLLNVAALKQEAAAYFGLGKGTKVLLIVGGSLGARTLNESVLANLETIKSSGIEVIWQTGSIYYKKIIDNFNSEMCPNLHIHEFLSRMDLAYSVADLVISRAGAGTISELCLMNMPSILVPSPNVAEDHQTKNAMALVNKNAALFVADVDAKQNMIDLALKTISNSDKLNEMAQNISSLARPNAADDIAEIVIELANKNKK